jgi:1,4-dihydroxy-2-naphthoate octaprenyltransferase
MNVKSWIAAFRPRTLPLALSSIAMSGLLAASAGKFNGLLFTLCCVTTIFLQVLSNLANDYGDTVNGADHAGRIGPQRAVQSGAITPAAMRIAITLFVGLSLASGLSLLFAAFGWNLQMIGFFLVLGVLSIIAAIAYTVGRKPYGYMGLGDISVLIFFGLIGVMGSYYLFTLEFTWAMLGPALSCGFFSVAVLNINNIRDIDSDRAAGKYSIPVRVGKDTAAKYHCVLLIGGWLAAIAFVATRYTSPVQWIFVVSAPLFFINGQSVTRKPSSQLDPYLKQMALSTLIFVLLFGLGQWLATTS